MQYETTLKIRLTTNQPLDAALRRLMTSRTAAWLPVAMADLVRIEASPRESACVVELQPALDLSAATAIAALAGGEK